MKKFTIIASIALVLVFAGLMVAVALMPDFKKPTRAAEGEDPDAPVWSMTIDELVDFLYDRGVIKSKDRTPLTDGTASIAFSVDGVDLYWWDLDNLSEDSAEMRAYTELVEEGQIDLWGMGKYFMTLTKNGPFGLYVGSEYGGSAKDLLDAFAEFGQNAD